MSGETILTVIGNLVAAPELRHTPTGIAVANFTVASTSRVFDRQSNEWKDGDAVFLRCSVWRDAAENIAESLTRGARIIVSGTVKQRSYETKDGEKRSVLELEVIEAGPSLKYATAKVTRANRTGAQTNSRPATVEDDPWGSPLNTAPAMATASSGGGDEPPF
ncbi:single-stranded DNA-binding protein [Nocardia sp. NPDC058658]|uniref:single-stranded DNA-binding protein n=1 Tax=Nocardia sp. NPDC058658 TaxID=3346580 RepID=UPI003650BEC0